MRIADGRPVRSQIDDSERLIERNVLASVGHRLINGEVIKLSIAALLTLRIKSKERMARALE